MPATLVWGKGFRVEATTTPLGEPFLHVVGVDGGSDMLSWSSVGEMEDLAEQHGVNKQLWPIYPDCEIESEVPLEEAEMRSAQLRVALEGLDAQVVEGSYWLNYIWKVLRQGNSFFIMV